MNRSVVYTLKPWTILDLAILQEFVARGALMKKPPTPWGGPLMRWSEGCGAAPEVEPATPALETGRPSILAPTIQFQSLSNVIGTAARLPSTTS